MLLAPLSPYARPIPLILRKDLSLLQMSCLARHQKTLAIGGTLMTPDSDPFAPGKFETGVVLWDLTAGREKRFLNGDGTMVQAVCFSPDGGTLACAHDRTILLWNLHTFQEQLALRGNDAPVLSMQYLTDGKTLLSGAADGVIKLWDLKSGQVRAFFKGHPDIVSSLVMAPDNKVLFSASVDGTIRSWDVKRAASVMFTDTVLALAFTPDSKTLRALDEGGMFKRIDAASGRTESEQHQISLEAHARLRSPDAAFFPDGLAVASQETGFFSSAVSVFRLTAGKKRKTVLKGTPAAAVLAFSPDGTTLAVESSLGGRLASSGVIQLWDLNTAKKGPTLKGHTDGLQRLLFSPDGHSLLSASRDRTLKLWDIGTGKERLDIPGSVFVSSLVFSSDSRRFAVAATDTVRILDSVSGKELHVVKTYPHRPTVMAFSPDVTRLATGGGAAFLGQSSGVKLWDLVTGREVLGLRALSQGVSQLVFSPDGSRLAAAFEGRHAMGKKGPYEVRIWDASP
jgi:WD40 repeat protein